MDEENIKVFSSKITRGQQPLNNDLHNLINLVPAVPKIINNSSMNISCDFKPLTDKYYVPKKRHQLKVKTVRDIRKEFEKDVYSFLNEDLDKQQNYLLRKIRFCSLRDENIKSITKKMLSRDSPISRSAWQMLMNVNPEGHTHTNQYVLWNGKRIQVNGSRGGNSRFLCNYDLGNSETPQKALSKRKPMSNMKGLLRNSLLVRFKPGPLTKKKYLDYSYQKYHIGDTKLVKLPKPGLDIQPAYGLPLETSVTNFLNNLQDVDGTITEKWAELAVTMLGTVKGKKSLQVNEGCCVTFDLKYKCDQNRILMRQDTDKISEIKEEQDVKGCVEDDKCVIETVLEDILNCVEISIQQDNMYTGEDEPRELLNLSSNTLVKDKIRKKYGELDRLAVTVIRLSESAQTDELQHGSNKQCCNSFCSLGCLCSSLQCTYKLKSHCGRIECMFECKCDFSKYKDLDLFESDCSEFMPGLLKLDNEINLTLAKEEKKFHQTVIMTEDKGILLKSHRRNWKTSKKYAEFYSNMCLKTEMKTDCQLTIVLTKLNPKNVEPWCMVHNLYKCFCKGNFTHSYFTPSETNDTNDVVSITDKSYECDTLIRANNDDAIKDEKRVSTKHKEVTKKQELHECSETKNSTDLRTYSRTFNSGACARIRPYHGRRQNIAYYNTTNKKIKQMEKDDTNLHKKLMSRIYKDVIEDNHNNKRTESSCISENEVERSETSIPCVSSDDSIGKCVIRAFSKEIYTNNNSSHLTPHKNKLKSWFEASYEQYKQRKPVCGKIYLEPPKKGRVALYPWDFILTRYREKKNHFLVLKKSPFRIFMAIDTKHDLFKNCIDIDNIRFDDLHIYPVAIKYLLTNATDFNDSFCILLGLSHCWELFGSVRKVNTEEISNANSNNFKLKEYTITSPKRELDLYKGIQEEDEVCIELKRRLIAQEKKQAESDINLDSYEEIRRGMSIRKMKVVNGSEDDNQRDNNIASHNKKKEQNASKNFKNKLKNARKKKPSKISLTVSNGSNDSIISNDNLEKLNSKTTNNSDFFSKWFLMTIENEFREIQFYNKGFFVEYESIIETIELSRKSGKTIKLSSQKCLDPNNVVQFGVYAIPNVDEYCAFVGPYEINEPMGMEILKTQGSGQNQIKSVWITTNKVDNVKLIGNPLSYLPEKKVCNNETSLVDTEQTCRNQKSAITLIKNKMTEDVTRDNVPKLVKPIKIRKTNQIYYIAPDGLIKEVPNNQIPEKKEMQASPNIILLNKAPVELGQGFTNIRSISKNNEYTPMSSSTQVKSVLNVTQPCSSGGRTNLNSKPERGMFILKPEEINKRAIEQRNILTASPSAIGGGNNVDIESFLTSSIILSVPKTDSDVYVISDDDCDDCREDSNSDESGWQEVWIQCKNFSDLGWISGRRRRDSLSFEFPGFNYSQFYEEKEALIKMTQVLSRKVPIRKDVQLEWHVVESKEGLTTDHKLTLEDLLLIIELTKDGARFESTVENTSMNAHNKSDSEECFLFRDLDEDTSHLENEGAQLWEKAMTRSCELRDSLQRLISEEHVSDDIRSLLTKNLQNIMENANNTTELS